MPELSPKQLHRVDGICRNCERFLQLRAQFATRLKPELTAVADLLVWQKLAEVREALASARAFGNETYLVADLLSSVVEDEEKRNALLSAQGEASLFARIGPGRRLASEADNAAPASLASCYEFLDADVARFAELVGLWAWWDLPDAADLYAFDQIAQRCDALKSAAIGEQVAKAYRTLLERPADAEITREDMLGCEAKNFRRVLGRFARRREEEPVCRRLLAIEPREQGPSDQLILDIATRLTAVQRIQASPVLDPRARLYYSQAMGLPNLEVSAEKAMAYEREHIAQLKSRLMGAIDSSDVSPTAIYDYKQRLLKQLQDRCANYAGSGTQ